MCMLFKIVKLVAQDSKGRMQVANNWEKVLFLQNALW